MRLVCRSIYSHLRQIEICYMYALRTLVAILIEMNRRATTIQNFLNEQHIRKFVTQIS